MKILKAGKPVFILMGLVFIMMIMSCSLANAATDTAPVIKIDGKVISTDAAPEIINGTTMVPVATIVNNIGGTADWDYKTQTVTLTSGDTKVILVIGDDTAVVNGSEQGLRVASYIKVIDSSGGGRTMIPLRFVGENFGYTVDWIDASRTVTLDKLVEGITVPVKQAAVKQVEVKGGQTVSGKSGTYSIVKVTFDMAVKAADGVSLSNPSRYYIDISGAEIGSGVLESYAFSKEDSPLTSVRLGIPETGKVRVVADLSKTSKPIVTYSADGTTLSMAFLEDVVKEAVSVSVDTSATPDKSDTGNVTTVSTTPEVTGHDTLTAFGTVKKDTIERYDPFEDGKLVVVLDPGHGDTTGGKRSFDGSLREYEFNRDVAYRLKALLEAKGVTVIVTMTENEKGDPSLATRCKIANEYNKETDVDLFVSIHANAYGSTWNTANGWEVYSYKSGGVSQLAAKALEKAMRDKGIDLKDRGTKTEAFYVIKNTEMPAVLIEHGFYSNLTEVEKLKDSGFRQDLAEADCDGIMNFFNSFK